VGDGACFYHSVMFLLNKNYRKYLNIGDYMSRKSIVEEFKEKISKFLIEKLKENDPKLMSLLDDLVFFGDGLNNDIRSGKDNYSHNLNIIIDKINEFGYEFDGLLQRYITYYFENNGWKEKKILLNIFYINKDNNLAQYCIEHNDQISNYDKIINLFHVELKHSNNTVISKNNDMSKKKKKNKKKIILKKKEKI